MKNKIKKIIYMVIIGVAVLGFSYIYAHIDKNSYIYDRNMDTSLYYGTGILKGGQSIEQTFISEEETIDGINLKVSQIGNVENVILHYSITDVQTGENVAASIPTIELNNNKFNQLAIPQIKEAKGKTYTLILTVENSDEQNGVSFHVAPGTVEGQKLNVTGNTSEGALVVRMICRRFDMETFIVLLGIVLFVVVFMKKLYKSFR